MAEKTATINWNLDRAGASIYFQRRGAMNKFDEKFEKDDTHHSFCLRADGCFKRHDLPRDQQYLNADESRRAEINTFSHAESADRRLINKVAYLQSIGCVLKADETLEEYVERNADKLSEEV